MRLPLGGASKLQLELLGSGRLLSGDGDVLLPAGMPLTLLAYVYQSQTGVSRDALVKLFWPGSDRTLGLQSLRQNLTRIRRATGDAGILSRGRLIVADRDRFSSDIELLQGAIETGDAERALSLWKGGFLTDTRVPESWELEDWLERERGRYRGMLLASLLAVGDQALALPRPSRETLTVFDEACLKFPWEEGLHQLRFELNLKAGLLARASGFLEELRSQEDLGLPLDHLEAELEQARAAQVSTAWTEIEDLDELPEAWEKPRGQPVRFAIGATLILLLIAIQAGLFGPRGPREADLANHFLIVCTQPTVVQPGESALQLFRMDLDGRNQERISGQRGCSLFWLEEAEVGVFANWYSDPDQPWLFRMTPKANPKAEWEQVPLQSGAAGFTILGDGFHGGPPEVAGRYAVLKGIRDDGQQAMFLIDPVADTLRQITPLGPWYRTPVWDPIREELIFGAEVDGSRDLWAMKVLEPGMPWRRLTQSPSQDARPAVHGDQILFVRGRGTGPTEGDYAIHLLNRATGQEEVLVSRPWNDFMPRWSPDGRHLCWTSEEFGHFESDIWVMELATRSMRNLTAPLPGRNYECRWGPDSRTVFFVSTSTGEAQVYRARSDNRFIENISRMNGQTVHGWVLPSSVIDRFVE